MKEVVLKSGTILKADVVVAGIGNIITIESVLFLFPWFGYPEGHCLESFEGFFLPYLHRRLYKSFHCLTLLQVCLLTFSQISLQTFLFETNAATIFYKSFFFCIHCISEHFYLYVFFRRNPQYWLLERQQTGSWFKENFGCWQGDLCWQLNYLLHYIVITLIETIFPLRTVYQFYGACVFWF